MSYDSRERSRQDGKPVEIFTFAMGTRVWRFTSADRDVVADGQAYEHAVINRGGVDQGSEMNRSPLKLTVPRDFPIAELYRVAPPGEVVALVAQRFHMGDGEVATFWTGRVVNVGWSRDLAEATITCEPVFTSLRRTGLRRPYTRQCPHVLGGPACRVNLQDFAVAGTVSSVSALQVSAPEFGAMPAGYFDGGVLVYADAGGHEERRYIVAHSGSTLTVDRRVPGLEAAAVVHAMPGCDHTLQTCHAKFSNAANYGGQPFIPNKNPFGGDPVY